MCALESTSSALEFTHKITRTFQDASTTRPKVSPGPHLSQQEPSGGLPGGDPLSALGEGGLQQTPPQAPELTHPWPWRFQRMKPPDCLRQDLTPSPQKTQGTVSGEKCTEYWVLQIHGSGALGRGVQGGGGCRRLCQDCPVPSPLPCPALPFSPTPFPPLLSSPPLPSSGNDTTNVHSADTVATVSPASLGHGHTLFPRILLFWILSP